MRKLSYMLFEKGLIRFGEFTLSSGAKSPYYINIKGLVNYPRELKTIAKMMLDLLALKTDFDVIAGIATGGIPLAAFMSFISDKPFAYVRLERKSYGLEECVEGDVQNKKVVVVDDVATTGATIYDAVLALREKGAFVDYAIVVVDREEGASERLATIGVSLLSLTTAREIIRDLYDLRLIRREMFESLIRYIDKSRGADKKRNSSGAG